jgi:pimeloyl-ACP methyl ester carboxylesterase
MSFESVPTFDNAEKNSAEKRTFEQQFSNKEFIPVAGGIAEVVDIKPEHQKSETPVFFAPGWGCTLEVYKPLLEKISEENRRVITLNHPRIGGKALESVSRMNLEIPKEVSKSPEQFRKALNMLDIIDEKEIDKVDMVTHSESAINAVIAAVLRPEKFRNLILFAPAGLVGEDQFVRLMKGFIAGGKRAESMSDVPISATEKKVGADAIQAVVKYVLENPIRGMREVYSLSKSQIHEMLGYLHEKGIGIVVMSTIDDPVFPMDKIQQTVKADMVDGFLSLKGSHGEIGGHPELFIPAVESMLVALERKEQNKKIEDKTEQEKLKEAA